MLVEELLRSVVTGLIEVTSKLASLDAGCALEWRQASPIKATAASGLKCILVRRSPCGRCVSGILNAAFPLAAFAGPVLDGGLNGCSEIEDRDHREGEGGPEGGSIEADRGDIE